MEDYIEKIETLTADGSWRRVSLRGDGKWHRKSGKRHGGQLGTTHDIWMAPLSTKDEALKWVHERA